MKEEHWSRFNNYIEIKTHFRLPYNYLCHQDVPSKTGNICNIETHIHMYVLLSNSDNITCAKYKFKLCIFFHKKNLRTDSWKKNYPIRLCIWKHLKAYPTPQLFFKADITFSGKWSRKQGTKKESEELKFAQITT